MIKSSKLSFNYANSNKHIELQDFISEYKAVLSDFIDILWHLDKIPTLLPKQITNQIKTTWLSARVIQCCGKQASAIVRGTKAKQKRRLYMIKKLSKEGKTNQANKLQKIYNKTKLTKPSIDKVNPELDSRFIKYDFDNSTTFDCWVTISSMGNKKKLVLPVNKSKHYNKLSKKGTLKQGIRLSNTDITFMFDLPDIPKKQKGKIIGVDIGQNKTITCSNGYVSKQDIHGHNLKSITDRLARRKKGSKGFQRASEHRKNYVNWTINQLNLTGIKQVNLEKIKHLRKGRNTSRKLSHWNYTIIFDKLEDLCNEQGVSIQYIKPSYTSQRCSSCGWTQKANRIRELFKCRKCGLELDSDLNASYNIALPLSSISESKRLSKINRVGFYWLVDNTGAYSPCSPKNNKDS